jgi:hypothetical protein
VEALQASSQSGSLAVALVRIAVVLMQEAV